MLLTHLSHFELEFVVDGSLHVVSHKLLFNLQLVLAGGVETKVTCWEHEGALHVSSHLSLDGVSDDSLLVSLEGNLNATKLKDDIKNQT